MKNLHLTAQQEAIEKIHRENEELKDMLRDCINYWVDSDTPRNVIPNHIKVAEAMLDNIEDFTG